MITLIIGGSGSGKSEYAEGQAVEAAKAKRGTGTANGALPLYYVATMQPFGEETLGKIARHHELRKDKGFATVEQYVTIEQAANHWKKEAVVLLECMSNLLANECYQTEFPKLEEEEQVIARIVAGILKLEISCRHLLIVTNDVFASGEQYDEETMRYIQMLGRINVLLAEKADKVVEVVCGIPLVHKEQRESGMQEKKEN